MRFIKAQTTKGARIGVVRDDGIVELSDNESRLETYFGDDGENLGSPRRGGPRQSSKHA